MWFGYIDPGAGTIILQTLIAAALGVVIFFRNAVKRLFLLVMGRGKDAPESKPESDDSP